MDSPVVDNIGFDHFIAIRFHDFADRKTEQVVPDMSKMKWLIGVGGGVLHHYFFGVAGFSSKVFILVIF